MAGTTLPKSGANANTNTFVAEMPPANVMSGKASPPPNLPVILALDLGTHTGWALRARDGTIASGTIEFRNDRWQGGGMRFLRFKHWLTETRATVGDISAVFYEEVRAHAGVDAAHVFGGMLAILTAWCEHHSIPYEGVPVGTIKRHATGKGNAGKEAVIAAMKAKGHTPADDNEADALAILHWVLDNRKGI